MRRSGEGSERSVGAAAGGLARPRARMAAAGVLGVTAVLTGAVFFLLGTAGKEERVEGAEPLVVEARPAARESGYEVERRYTGRIEPRRRSEAGFELGGLVRAVGPDDGDPVEAGEVLARLDTGRLEARRAELVAAREEARAVAELAKATYVRTMHSYERGAASEQELDDAEDAREAAIAALARVERQIATVEVDIEKSTLRSPFAGIVARRLVDEGQVVAAGAPVFDVYERVEAEARIGVPARVASALRRDQRVMVRVRGEGIPGRGVRLLPVTERGTRTVEVVVGLEAELDGVRRGDLATLGVAREIEAAGFWVPIGALTESSRGLWACFVAAPDGEGGHRAERRQLEVLHTEAGRAYVAGALREGELVVTDGLQRIVAGLPVRVAGAEGGAGARGGG